MNCLCCGKPIAGTGNGSRWHPVCIRKFFGTDTLPELDVSEETLIRIASENTHKGYTVPGVQKKMSLHLSREGNIPRLALVDYPTGYILKPQTDTYPAMPEAEHLIMSMARKTGIATVPFALMFIGDRYAYITKRIDRILPTRAHPTAQMLAMEDFCQLEYRLTEDKYRGSYERCAKIVSKFSQRPGLDLSELFLRVVFSYAVGNSDMHLKNFSLIETAPLSGKYVLSEAYDMLPVNIVIPNDPEELALALNGKKRNIRRRDFLVFARNAGISEAAGEKMIRKVASMRDLYLEMCDASDLPEEWKESLAELIQRRTEILTG